ncbi:TGS domain protein [Synechococcus sp. PCC 7335]|nr:TGS domain protein [Synechococcus sp. PCC 7335]
MMDLSTLAQILLRSGLPSSHTSIDGLRFSEKSLSNLLELINSNHILLEEPSYTYVSMRDYIELLEEDLGTEEKTAIINASKDLIRISDKISYELLRDQANKLQLLSENRQLKHREYIDLVLASVSNTKFYITSNKKDVESFVSFFKRHKKKPECQNEIPYEIDELQIHDIDSFVNYIESETSFFDIIANQDTITVYTSLDKPITIKRGSTPVDFAYKIHTELGHSCYRAKVTRNYGQGPENWEIIECELSFMLENGDKVEIIKRDGGERKPDIAWKKFVVTTKAADSISSFWHKENIKRGATILKREFSKCYLGGNKFEYISRCLNCGSIEELQQQLGLGRIRIEDIRKAEKRYSDTFIRPQIGVSKSFGLNEHKDVSDIPAVQGLTSSFSGMLLISKCCYPMPKDRICGVEGERSVHIHKIGCSEISEVDFEKKLPLTWNSDECTAVLKLKLKDREDILRYILNKWAENNNVRVNVSSVLPDKRLYPTLDATSIVNVCVLFSSIRLLKSMIKEIEDIPDTIQVTIRSIFPGPAAFLDPERFI